MGKIVKNFLLLLLLVAPSAVFFAGQESKASNVAFAKEDTMEGEEDETEATVETDAADDDVGDTETAATDKDEPEESEDDQALKPSPDADTYVHFTRPSNPLELPAGKPVRILVGFTNKGNVDFVVDSMEASFRYPQDFSFFLQNFTTIHYNSVVEPRRQATFEYGFNPNEAFSSRPFGLSVLLNYKDAEGNVFQTAVFNETVQVTEPDDGLDGETFFMYIFLIAIVILLLFGAHQLFLTYGRKHLSRPRRKMEMGTQNSDIDYDWIPKETLQALNKSPRRSPKSPKSKQNGKQSSKSSKQSPRQRRSLRSSGSLGEE